MNKLSFPSGNITFLFTDIEGSTKLWEKYPEAMKIALANHDTLLQNAIQAHKGYIFKTVGDAFYAAFPSAEDALAAAMVIQKNLALQDWGEVGLIKVRMALHTGQAQQRDNDYFGPTLNRVARLLSVGSGEQILLSASSAAIVKNNLAAPLQLRDLGEFQLKDLNQPERIYQLNAPGLRQDFPPLKASEVRRHNLPVSLTSFIGREKEIAEIKQLLATSRLLTLFGAGGVGKTRLALQVAEELLPQFKDGVFFIALENTTERATFVTEVAAALGVSDQSGKNLPEVLRTWLEAKEILFVLDNFEQLIPKGAAMLAEMLKFTPKLKVLVTSRESLRLSIEREYHVQPLALPAKSEIALEDLTKYPAIALFVERATITKPDFKLTAENSKPVVELCRKLDGLPLALELAAARLKVLSPQKILERLSLKLLANNNRDLPARQQTLWGAIDWSHDLLEPAEKNLFARLSIFADGCTLEAAETVCNTDFDLGFEVFEGIESLLQKNLMRQWEGSDGETRYGMLQTIREYALQKLAESGNFAEQFKRFADYYVDLTQFHASKLTNGQTQLQSLKILDSEDENLREILYHALVLKTENLIEAGLAIAVALRPYWYIRGYYGAGWRYVEQALNLAVTKNSARQGSLLDVASHLHYLMGNYEEAAKYGQSGLTLCKEDNNLDSSGNCLRILGNVAFMEGDYNQAICYYEEAILDYKQVGNKRQLSGSLSNIGAAAFWQGNYEKVVIYSNESLSVAKEIGDRQAMGMAIQVLGAATQHQGNYISALTFLEQALALFEELGDRGNKAFCLNDLAEVAINLGNLAKAGLYLQQALQVGQEIGDKRVISRVLNFLGYLATWQGNFLTATHHLEEAYSILQKIMENGSNAECQYYLGFLSYMQGNFAAANKWWGESLALANKIGYKLYKVLALVGLANTALSQESYSEAARYYQEVLVENQNGDYKREIATAFNGLAIIETAQGNYAEARNYSQQSLTISYSLEDKKVIAETLCTVIDLQLQLLESSEAAKSTEILSKLAQLLGAIKVQVCYENRLLVRPTWYGIYRKALQKTQQELQNKVFEQAFWQGENQSLEDSLALALEFFA